MTLQALVFDLDGTVAETADLHRAAFNLAFAESGLGWHWDREIFSQLSPVKFALPKLRMFMIAARQAGHTHLPTHELLAKVASHKARLFCEYLRAGAAHLRPGVARLMQEARHEGLALAAISTHSRAEAQTLLSVTLGFSSLSQFASLKTSENVKIAAPEASLYQAVLQDLGLKSRQSLALVDSAISEKAARKAGMSVIATPGLYTSSNRFGRGTLVVSDLGQPDQPFTVLQGDAGQQSCISPSMLQNITSPKAAAA